MLGLLKLLGFLVVEGILFMGVGPALFGRPSPRSWVNDYVYPAAVTLLLTGGGATALYLLSAPFWLATVGFVVMFLCSAFACLGGRFLLSSILSAAGVMVLTFGLILALFLAAWSPPASAVEHSPSAEVPEHA
jgi:hypothetical protein